MMASDTVPAAAPGPNEPAGTTPTSPTGTKPRGLAGLLAAVDPARPDGFTLHPTTSGSEQTVTGASSADYHAGNTDSTTSGKTGTGGGKQQHSIVRAWLLAGAERWKQGGVTRNKRLDMEKARHQANQVKENRTVTVNRSGGLLGGNSSTRSSSGSGKGTAGKSLTSKTNGSGGGSKGPKNSSSGPSRNGSSGTGTHGRGGSGGHSSHGAGGGAGRGTSGHHTNSSTRGSKHSGKNGPATPKETSGTRHGGDLKPRTPKTDTSKTSRSDTSAGTGSSKTGKDGKAGATGPAGSNGKPLTKPAPNTPPAPADKPRKTDHGPKSSSSKTDLTKKTTPDKPNKPAPTPGKPGPAGPDQTTSKTTLTKDHKQPPAKTPTTPAPGTGRAPGKRLNVQASRETGYRDGTRAATVAAHIGAWRDGVRDGWTDTQAAADAEKTRLDHAHAARQQQRDKDQPVTGPATSADYHPTTQQDGPAPIQVASIDATHIHLGDSATRTHISRGEVRTLAGFQRRMTTKTDQMTAIAERSRAFEAHAKNQTAKALDLLEQAKTVKGGEKLTAALTKLHEAAQVQEGKAAEVRKRALRAADACQTVNANADTRYGDIYRAVINSPETAPAELAYYRDLGVTHA